MISRQNALFGGRGNKSMADTMREREEELFTPMERLILKHLRESDDGFIAINEDGLYEQNSHELFKAIKSLKSKGIIKDRTCEATAYEWADTSKLYL